MIDTHTHLNFPDLLGDLEGVLARAEEAGVGRFVVPGTTLEDSVSSLDLAAGDERIFGCVGLHPCHIDPYGEAERKVFSDLLEGEKRVGRWARSGWIIIILKTVRPTRRSPSESSDSRKCLLT